MKRMTIIAFVTAPSGREGELVEEFRKLVPPTSAEPGCLAFRAYQHPKIANRFVVYEEFRDQGAIDAHLKLEHTKRFVEWIQSSGSLVSFEFWDRIS